MLVGGVVAVGAAVRLALAAAAPLLSAEAYYGLWAREPAWGYHDHPPGVAALIRLGDALLGPTPLGIRLGHVLAVTLAFVLFHRLCRRLVDDRTALLALVALQFSPFGLPLGTLALPDGPLLLTWTAALLFFHRALTGDRWTDWLVAGVCTGLGMLSKYNAFQLPLIFAVTLWVTPGGRARLAGPRPWVALAVALALVAPNLAWNAARPAAGALSTPFADGLEPGKLLANLTLYAALLPLALSPVLGWRAIRSVRSALRDRVAADDVDARFLLTALLVPCALFALVSLVTRVHAHWVATAVLPAIPLALRPVAGTSRRPAVVVCCALTALIVAAGLVVPHLGGAPTNPGGWPGDDTGPLAQIRWKVSGDAELRARLEDEIAARSADGAPFLASTNYHQLARSEWLIDRRVPAVVMRHDDAHQYAIWQDGSAQIGRNALWVEGRRRKRTQERIAERFERFTVLAPVTVEIDGSVHERFELYWCEGFRGVPGLTPGVPLLERDDPEDER